jgi:transposase-like protein
VDGTYIKVVGQWHSLYRAIDRDGKLVDSLRSAKRDLAAAKMFCGPAQEVTGGTPEPVTTEGHDSYPRASSAVLGDEVVHRTNRDLNNRIDQDQHRVKQRYYPLRELGSSEAAASICRADDEQRNYFRARKKPKEQVARAEQRGLFRQRLAACENVFTAA